jgi:hypothetical protein
MKRIKLGCLMVVFTLQVSCSEYPNSKEITFSLVVSSTEQNIEQGCATNNLFIDSTRVIQIVDNKIFVEKLDMDWYVFHISNINHHGDSLISFSIDKEALYGDFISGQSLNWSNIHSGVFRWYSNVTIKKEKNGLLWILQYCDKDNEDTGQQLLIRNEDIEKSRLQIFLYD